MKSKIYWRRNPVRFRTIRSNYFLSNQEQDLLSWFKGWLEMHTTCVPKPYSARAVYLPKVVTFSVLILRVTSQMLLNDVPASTPYRTKFANLVPPENCLKYNRWPRSGFISAKILAEVLMKIAHLDGYRVCVCVFFLYTSENGYFLPTMASDYR